MSVITVEASTKKLSLEELLFIDKIIAQAKGRSTKKKEGEEIEEKVTAPKKSAGKVASKKEVEDVDDEEDVEEKDDWEKEEEDENWDPDFEEFDLPKSKKGIGKKSGGEEEDFKFDDNEEFKDLFSGRKGGGSFDDEDDF